MRKNVFGLDDVKRMNTRTLDYIESETKSKSL